MEEYMLIELQCDVFVLQNHAMTDWLAKGTLRILSS